MNKNSLLTAKLFFNKTKTYSYDRRIQCKNYNVIFGPHNLIINITFSSIGVMILLKYIYFRTSEETLFAVKLLKMNLH